MAFKLNGLENHSGSGAGLKMFSYNHTDNKATVKGTGYFNEGAGLMEVGSRISIHASDADFDCHVSAISAAGVVTIAAVDAFA
jgi:hypothetical protein|tara:strand:+ start:4175 stop:4423 length:249 start_codon:yes stop_codon:yes gene_type:complete